MSKFLHDNADTDDDGGYDNISMFSKTAKLKMDIIPHLSLIPFLSDALQLCLPTLCTVTAKKVNTNLFNNHQ